MAETLTVLIFIFTYLTIAVQKIPVIRIDRPSGVLAGSTLLIIAGSITLPEAYGFINWDVITFLIGMMIITAYLEYAGFFPLAAQFIMKTAKTGRQLLLLIIASSAALSALFVNDTICLLFTPVLLAATKELKINPIPFLLAIAFASNVGSALTVTGNPQNMYIGIVSGIPFIKFILYTAIPVLMSLGLVYLVLTRLYKNELGILTREWRDSEIIYDKTLMVKALFTLVLVLALFLCNVSYPFAALIGATVIILCGRITPRIALARVDWQLLIFFAGLFVVMGALSKTGLMSTILSKTEGLVLGSEFVSMWTVGTITLVLSNLVSNLPAVMMIYPPLQAADAGDSYGIYLALISTFAGNLTIVGSVANLIVIECARMQGVNISFMQYFRAGLVVTIGSCLIATIFMLIR